MLIESDITVYLVREEFIAEDVFTMMYHAGQTVVGRLGHSCIMNAITSGTYKALWGMKMQSVDVPRPARINVCRALSVVEALVSSIEYLVMWRPDQREGMIPFRHSVTLDLCRGYLDAVIDHPNWYVVVQYNEYV